MLGPSGQDQCPSARSLSGALDASNDNMNLLEILEIIREFINNPRKQYELIKVVSNWHTLCVALDIIGDTDMAVNAYIVKKPNGDYGDKYLTAYGILQVLFVQQDAVEYLHKSLKIPYAKDPVLQSIRDIRNDSIGHPIRTDRKGKPVVFNFITRISLTSKGFDLIKTFPDKVEPQFSHVNIIGLVKKQQKIHHAMLTNIVKSLKEEDMKHKKKFANERLRDIFPPTLSYFIEKIIESIYGGKPAEYGQIHVKIISDLIYKFKSALISRGVYDAYDTVKYEIELLEYPIEELRKYFDKFDKSHINQKDAYIFAYFVKKRMESLKEIASDIDREYSSV